MRFKVLRGEMLFPRCIFENSSDGSLLRKKILNIILYTFFFVPPDGGLVLDQGSTVHCQIYFFNSTRGPTPSACYFIWPCVFTIKFCYHGAVHSRLYFYVYGFFGSVALEDSCAKTTLLLICKIAQKSDSSFAQSRYPRQ